MTFVKYYLAATALAGSVVLASPASAATAVSISGFSTFVGDGPWTLGYSFTALQDLSVTALGAFDDLGDGFADAHEVGLWDSSGTLISSISVSGTDTLIDGFRYANIASVNLIAGTTYTVGASNFGVNDAYAYNATLSSAPEITVLDGQFINGGGLRNPVGSAGGVGGYFGGNFQFSSAISAAPEPGTWAMMILGFGLAGAALRRRPTVTTRVSYAV